MSESTFNFDDAGLRKLLKAMESEHFVRIGIFGGTHPKGRLGIGAIKKAGGHKTLKGSDTGTTNAEVGMLMEYGVPKTKSHPAIPARSWLRMPIVNKINDIVKEASKDFLLAAKSGDAMKFLKTLGISAEAWIQRAFASGGFGGWAPNAPGTVRRKGSASPLIDTGQLRRSVASQVI